MKTEDLAVIRKFRKYKVLVVGDFILDGYLHGSCTRLAPEAAVPVVDVIKKNYCLGGSANAAANLCSLGAEVFYCTVIGNDAAASRGLTLLRETGIKTESVVSSPQRDTIVKTRVDAPSHTIVRFDEGTESHLDLASETELIDRLHLAYFQCDAVLVVDYDKGVLTPTVIAELKKLKLLENKFFGIDSKRLEMFSQLSPSLVKPNYEEAICLLSLPRTYYSRVQQLKPYGSHFQKKTNAALVAVTLDVDGAIFFKNGEFAHTYPAVKVKDPKVSGAGDTFVSALLLALLAGTSVPVAAEIASAAASVAISKNDTAVCAVERLMESLSYGQKNLSLVQLKNKCKQLRLSGQRVVFTNGCFDILHSGHVNYLRQAKEMGDILVVGVNNDNSIKRLKGEDRPINSLDQRIEVLSALSSVDFVIPFGNDKEDGTPVNLIKHIKPHLFVKGEDYRNKYLPEENLLKKIGCKIAFIPFVFDQSTSKIISKVKGDEPGQHQLTVVN